MSLALALPPELLLDIFSLAIPESPTRIRSEYLTRQRNLNAFSLVHRSWTRLARAKLQEEIWVDWLSRFETGRRGRSKGNGIRGTKFLTVAETYESVLKAPIVMDGWIGLTYLRCLPKYGHTSVGLAEFAQLANLKTLHLDGGSFVVSDVEFSCPNLERLTFGGTLKFSSFGFNLKRYQATFNPKRLPKLVNLSLDIDSMSGVPTEVFANILPQLETLALSDRYHCLKHDRLNPHLLLTRGRLTEMLGYARNLKHLALPIAFDATSLLKDHNFKVSLETLHLPIKARPLSTVDRVWRDSTRTWLVDSLKGSRTNVKIDKVFIYESKKKVIERWPGTELDLFKWKEDWMRAPFENFDGK